MKEDVIRAHAELPALCEQIHLPLQSGSSAVLKRMRRTYDRQRYMDRVALIREHVPDCAITTDIIVGFPGETEADFAETLEVVGGGRLRRRLHLRLLAAARNRGGDDGRTSSRTRSRSSGWSAWSRWSSGAATERAQRFVGRTMEVLVEGPSRTDETRLRGRTRHNKAVNFEGIAEPGEFVEVEIEGATSQTLPRRRREAALAASLTVLAIFGPTGVGKTGVAIELARSCGERGEDPVAINCDALQVYEGLEALTGAASAAERELLRAPAARVRAGHRGLLDRRLHAARPRRGRRGAGGGADADRGRRHRPLPAGGARRALAASKAPAFARTRSSGPPETRHPTPIFGLDMDRAALYERIDARVEAIVAGGAEEEARRADALGPGRTARKALGFDELLAGDLETMKKRSRNYARRQLTWMRKIPNLTRSTAPTSATPQAAADRRASDDLTPP